MMAASHIRESHMAHTQSRRALHLQRVQRFFASSPPVSAETIEIVLRSYLHIPDEFIDDALLEAQRCHQSLKAA